MAYRMHGRLRAALLISSLLGLSAALVACSSDLDESNGVAPDASNGSDAGSDHSVADAAADGHDGDEAGLDADVVPSDASDGNLSDGTDGAGDVAEAEPPLEASVDAIADVMSDQTVTSDAADALADVTSDAADALADVTSDAADALADVTSDQTGSDAADATSEESGVTCTSLPTLKLTKVFGGLSGALLVTSAPGDASRLYIVQQNGEIRVAKAGVLLASPFLNVSGLLSTGGERGLLGLAFHPSYGVNGRFWINYTNTNGDTAIAEYRRSTGNADVADSASGEVLFTVSQPQGNHNGGMIAFGPDGYLYVGMGDGGGGGDPDGNGQKLNTKLAKMLRVDVDAYPTPPPGNMAGLGVDPQIWAYGVRNPWRFSFDRQTGDLYIGDVGQGTLEEVNVAPSGVGWQNYGWNVMEGTACYPPGSTCSTSGKTLPVVEYDHNVGCSITGGYVYRGQAIPCLRGRYLYGDYCTRRVWSFVWDGASAQDPQELTADLQSTSLITGLTSFGEDANGELYVCSSTTGEVFRIDAE